VSIAELGRALAAEFARAVPGAQPARFESVSADQFYGPGYDDSRERVPDIEKARRLLDWMPLQSLSDMLPGIVEDYVARYGPRMADATAAPQASFA
jgi:UDP-apiose/xylose synthase